MGVIQETIDKIQIRRQVTLQEVRNKIGNVYLSKLPPQDIGHYIRTILGEVYTVPELQEGMTTRTPFYITCNKCGRKMATCIGYICTRGICDCEVYSCVDLENFEVPYTMDITESTYTHSKSVNKIIHKRYKEYREYLGLGLSNPIPELFRISALQSIYKDSPYTFTNDVSAVSGECHTIKQYCKIHNATHIRKFREIVRHGAAPCCVKSMSEKQVGTGRGRKITDTFFKQQLQELYPNIKLISPYKTANTPATFYCETCGYTWNKKPAALIRNTRWGCPNCHKIEIENRSDDRHTFHIKCKMRKELIKEKYNKFVEENPIEWKDGYRCMTTDYYIAGIKACRDDWNDYSYDKVDFVNQDTKVTITCKKHGDFQMLPLNFRYGQDCPRCAIKKYAISSGEQQLIDFFEENKIEFEFQKKFKDCRDKKVLPFDFMIKIGSVSVLVEYDGAQHFIDIPYWNKGDALITRKRHDTIKTEYAKTHKIPLYRITLDQYVTDGWLSMKDFKELVLSKI